MGDSTTGDGGGELIGVVGSRTGDGDGELIGFGDSIWFGAGELVGVDVFLGGV